MILILCAQGYQDITYALQCNRSMRHIPFPTYDLQPAMKTSPERVDAIIRRMQVVQSLKANEESNHSEKIANKEHVIISGQPPAQLEPKPRGKK